MLGIGKRGRVLHPSFTGTETTGDVACQFPGGQHPVYLLPEDIVTEAEYSRGEQANQGEMTRAGVGGGAHVAYIPEWERTNGSGPIVRQGDFGTILGPSGAKGKCVCDFPHWKGAHVRIDELQEKAAYLKADKERQDFLASEVLAGGFKRGSRVVSLFNGAGRQKISRGMLGTVRDRGGGDEKLLVYFPKVESFKDVRPNDDVVSESDWEQIKADAEAFEQRAGYAVGDAVVVTSEDVGVVGAEAAIIGVDWNHCRGMPTLVVKLTTGKIANCKACTDAMSIADWKEFQLQEAQQVLSSLRDALDDDQESWNRTWNRACNRPRSSSVCIGRGLLDSWQAVSTEGSALFERMWTTGLGPTGEASTLSTGNLSSMQLVSLASQAVGWRDEASDREAFSRLACEKCHEVLRVDATLGFRRSFASLALFRSFASLALEHHYCDVLGAIASDCPELSTSLIDLEHGWTALHVTVASACSAKSEGNIHPRCCAVVKMLCGLPGADPYASSTDGHWTPLHFAAQGNLCDVAEELLAASTAGIDLKTRDGFTALVFACVRKNRAMVQLLVDSGASLVAKDRSSGDTLLHEACAESDLAMVELLVNAGADPDVHNKKGKKPQALLQGSASQQKPFRSLLKKARERRRGKTGTGSKARPSQGNDQARSAADSVVSPGATPSDQQSTDLLSNAQTATPLEAQAEGEGEGEEEDEQVGIAKAGAKRIKHIQELIRDLVIDSAPLNDDSQPKATDWVGEMKDGIVPLENEGTVTEPDDRGSQTDGESRPKAEPEPNDLDDESALSLEGLPFEFEITKEASNQLSRLDRPLMRAAMRRMREVGLGNTSGRLWHPLKKGIPNARPGEQRLELYSTSFLKQWRVLWELSPAYSSKNQAWTDIIRVWYVGKHKEYEQKAIDEVIKCWKEGGTCIPEMRKRLKRQGKQLTGNLRKPSLYTVMAAHAIADPVAEPEPEPEPEETQRQSGCEHCPPATVVDDSRTLVKFYQMNEAFCSLVLRGILSEKLQFPFKTDQVRFQFDFNSINSI
eukprot:COSAG04_NODE_699_length_11044_cov_4.121243_4_plen_1030_part_00